MAEYNVEIEVMCKIDGSVVADSEEEAMDKLFALFRKHGTDVVIDPSGDSYQVDPGDTYDDGSAEEIG